MPGPKKRGSVWSIWFAISMLPAIYALSLGPACWLVAPGVLPFPIAEAAYRPLVRLIALAPESFHELVRRYCDSPVTLKYPFGRTTLEAPYLHMKYDMDLEDLLKKAGISITEHYVLPYVDKSGSVEKTSE